MISVVMLAPGRQWDQTLLNDLIAGDLWPHGLEFERLDAYPLHADGIVLICPGRYYADHTAEISEAIARYRWVLAFRCGDEEDLFDIAAVRHSNLRWWVQTPKVGKDYGDARFLPLGYTPHLKSIADPPHGERFIEVFLSAQRTHIRRIEAFNALYAAPVVPSYISETEGFTQGMEPELYARYMTGTKVAPAPSGAFSPDSFRLYEALEAHAVPIADDVSPAYDSRGYWQRMFPGAPFPILTNYDSLPGYIEDALADYPRNANRIAAWWMLQKRTMALNLREDLQALGAL